MSTNRFFCCASHKTQIFLYKYYNGIVVEPNVFDEIKNSVQAFPALAQLANHSYEGKGIDKTEDRQWFFDTLKDCSTLDELAILLSPQYRDHRQNATSCDERTLAYIYQCDDKSNNLAAKSSYFSSGTCSYLKEIETNFIRLMKKKCNMDILNAFPNAGYPLEYPHRKKY